MLVVALTGGIGSGKSLVAQLFSEKHISIIDADKIAKELVIYPSLFFKKIVSHFGTTILLNNHEINRKKLREIIIDDPKEKMWLEKLLHPPIWKKIKREIKQASSPYCIVVIPLLVETQTTNDFNRVLVVDCDESIQIERIKTRDKMSVIHIESLIKQQASRREKLAFANDIITNNDSIEHLKKQVEQLHQFYLQIASAQ